MSKKQYTLGIHDSTNSSVCLLEDDQIIYAIQEERLTKSKNEWCFPRRGIEEALKFANITASDIDYVALASKHSPKAPSQKNTTTQYKDETTLKGKLEYYAAKTPLYRVFQKRRREERLQLLEETGLANAKISFIEHHLCHASAAYYGLNVPKDEKVLVLTLDGSGDSLCSTVSVCQNGEMERIASTTKGHSLGNIYSRVTFMLGFAPLEHEYKLMGMAPYTSAYGCDRAYEVLKKYLKVSEGRPLTFQRLHLSSTTLSYARLRRDLELLRFDWVCAGLQKLTEELICQWVSNCVKETGLRKVVLSGGVFMNVKANQCIAQLEEVDQVYVMPSCGDETISFGAALRMYFQEHRGQNGKALPKSFNHIYLGNDIDDQEALKVLERLSKSDNTFQYEYFDDIEKKVAELLADQKVVARCKGRMEFGARALGNRSLLADPARLDTVREINMMVKKRDFWMPFAPVTRVEKANEYMNNPKGCDASFMMFSFNTTNKRGEFAAAVHQADATARFQVVHQEQNPAYYRVIQEFERLTSRGVLLNTSFNLHGYPIVYGPSEAMWVFQNSGLKYLAVGNYLVWKGEKGN